MKTKAFLLFIMLLATIGFAQTGETEKQQINTEEISANEAEPMAFNLAEVPPLASGCKAKWKVEKQRECTRKFIMNHINRNLNTDLVSELGLTGFFKTDVSFTIDKAGNINNISAKGGPEIMNQNAVEVIKILPQFTPAMHNGEMVAVYLKFPIAFDIQ
ncbi:energy transducer TonB [Aequorivita sp. F47161]|uniref:Energy transducer TonB n=1 Tax=Aequorivita vitellina TaxID=2874475 RepID=A0A9X1QUY2_9FLAO|nr:energy transducer TonB [Aequorivita vitellina]MCG2419333.1 energy transducer TonB [Aequorivita vitellina]